MAIQQLSIEELALQDKEEARAAWERKHLSKKEKTIKHKKGTAHKRHSRRDWREEVQQYI